MVQPLWKTVWQFLTKLNLLLAYDPAIMLLGIYPTDLKAYNHTTTYTRMFVETLFTVAKNVEATNLCVSVGRWIKKKTVVHPDNGILFSTKDMSCQVMKRPGGNLNSYY